MNRLALAVLLVAACDCAGEPEAPVVEESAGADPVAPTVVEPEGHHDHVHEGEEAPVGDDMVAAGCDQGRVDDCLELAERPGADRAAVLAQACRSTGSLCSVAGAGADPELLAHGCRAGSLPACRAWAEHGGGDAARERGCAAGWLEACQEQIASCGGTLADCVTKAREAIASGDLDAAQRLARVGCDGERTAGCVVWAEAYAEREPDAAKIALRRACFAEDITACQRLLERDDLTPMEQSRAGALARGHGF